jgi:hypothetical protein
LYAGPYGVWTVDADLDTALEPAELVGPAEVRVGNLVLVGSFSARTGSFLLQSRCRVLGGQGRLGTVLKPKAYHSDARVKVSTVANDAIMEAGETPGQSSLTTERLGVDFVRRAQPASQTLAQALGRTPWWVNYAGAVCIGERPATEVAGQYEVLDYDPRQRLAEVATDEPEAVAVGSVLRSRLAAPLRIDEIRLAVNGDMMRMYAWGREVSS